ncbi:2-polyprenylphenol 6-hydroxylase [Jannaschia sp. W003]|uniref:2-polyprenylphenol 6-hydroxylase n=1 Tax=Jannaschia sp. W003 TaxID=2867012 RepID=UPI0021A76D42|nr:2-polyprenylphenol 6-hydroxylase [Jannaschia sp. W003]UWQ21459.1 2-polyprenylphenol 6-hydroxylase [Jannaschia sp. W003]
MRGPHNIWRLIRTGATFERTGAMTVVLDQIGAPPALRALARVLGVPFKWLGYEGDPALPPVTRALTALGPSYIKFGQILSTRPDFVGDELALQLRVLQDKLPPFPTEAARATIRRELEVEPDALFSEFSEPVAAASIAQVHRARLAEDGRKVAVKVLRPGIARAFRRDIDAFYLGAWLMETVAPSTRRLRPRDVVAHFDATVQQELDLRAEAAAAGEFAANTARDDGFTVPQPEWNLLSRSVMVLDWVEGIPMGDVAAIEAAGHDRAALADRVMAVFLRHALRDGYFHADMHQGNLKVTPGGDIAAVDFGIMGRLDEYTRRVYAEILMGFIRKDYRRVAEVHFEAGYVPADRDVDLFAQALRSVGEPIFGMDASRISMGRLLAYLFEVTERFGMETRTELILLQRTMVVVEGVSRTLNPHMNIWSAARPEVERYIRENLGPQAVARDLWRTGLVLARFGPHLPRAVEDALRGRRGGTVVVAAARPRGLPAAAWFAAGAVTAAAAAAIASVV